MEHHPSRVFKQEASQYKHTEQKYPEDTDPFAPTTHLLKSCKSMMPSLCIYAWPCTMVVPVSFMCGVHTSLNSTDISPAFVSQRFPSHISTKSRCIFFLMWLLCTSLDIFINEPDKCDLKGNTMK